MSEVQNPVFMDGNKEEYIALMSEIIAKQAVILGPDIAILKARNVKGLVVSDQGKVEDVQGMFSDILQSLIDEYVNLSGQIVRNALGSVFAKYPSIEKMHTSK